MNTPRILSAVAASLWLLASGLPVSAVDVRADLSRRETYVGLPVTLQVRIVNAQDYERPEIPAVDGLEIESAGSPSRSSRVSIINGRRTSSTSITFAFRVTPQREGTFRIPSLVVNVDGRAAKTQPLSLVATKSETGDLMFVEVAGKQDSIYVGQALDLKLKIWLRPFRDPQRDVVLSEADMWKLISEQTNWGPFADRISELAADNRRPGGEEVLRDDSDGQERSYYLYEIDATIYPQRPGQIDGNDIRVIVNYPTSIGKSNDPLAGFFDDARFPLPSRLFNDDFFRSQFGSRLAVQSVRPIVAEAAVEPITVRPVPTAGRPADYRGAVGQYEIVAEAKPTRVAAGDPITLKLGIAGDGPLELVQAPPLHQIAELADDFKVPDEPLAGIVGGPRKVFSTTIRPRRAGIAEIPRIPLSYFDPVQEKFVTVYSDPIAISVSEAESLALDAIVTSDRQPQSEIADGVGPSEEGPRLQNFTGPALLDSQPVAAGSLSTAQQIALMMPPLVALLFGVVVRRRTIRAAIERLRSPQRLLEVRLARAENPADVASALSTYVNRRLGSDRQTDSRETALGQLRRAGHRDVAIELERLFHHCDQLAVRYESEQLTELRQQASRIAEHVQPGVGRRLQSRRSVKRYSGSAMSLLICLLPITPLLAADPPKLSRTSALEILSEAHRAYETAVESGDPDSDESRRRFTEAAEKYQMVVDSGVHNRELYFNLGNAYLQRGQIGRAIAGYHRALRIDPTWSDARNNLAHAKKLVGDPAQVAVSVVGSTNWAGRATDLLISGVHPRLILMLAIVCWYGIWIAVALRLAGVRVAWKSLATIALCSSLAAGGLYFYVERQLSPGSRAVVVAESVSLRAGDGENFAEVAAVSSSEGRAVSVLHQRGDWAQVRIGNQTGWLHRHALEVF